MPQRGDLSDLLSDAFGQVPPLSGILRGWIHIGRRREAIGEARRQGSLRAVGLLSNVQGGTPPGEIEWAQRLLIDPQRRAYRLELGDPVRRLIICDGTTLWTPAGPGEVRAQPSSGLPSLVSELLDPSWLGGYDFDPAVRDSHDGRDVLRVHALLGPNGTTPRSRPDPKLTDIEAIIDAQIGFLHRMTTLVHGQPFEVHELQDVRLDPPFDEGAFRIDDSSVRVIDNSEWLRRRALDI